jgi:hypothetical protein
VIALLIGLGLLGAEGSATWRCEPASVEVGQPFELVLELQHDPAAPALNLFDGAPQLDDSWVVLGRHDLVEVERGADGVISRVAWSLASLEPGERDLTGALATVAFGPAVGAIHVGGAHVEVAGVLAEGEDAPRGLRLFPPGFLDGQGDGANDGAPAWLAFLIVPPVLFAAWVLARRRRIPASSAPPGDLERLDELARGLSEQGATSGCYGLTRLLREAADRGGASRAGLTDDEWLAAVRAARAVPAPALEGLERVFARSERVKYGGERVTAWALEELFAEARSALRTLGTPSATGGGAGS